MAQCVTVRHTGDGKFYLCAIKDIFSNRIVGYSSGSRMKSRLATTALSNAVGRRGKVAGCILHIDRGSEGGGKFVHALGRYEMVGSMRRIGSADDNAASRESFFSLLQQYVS